MLHLQLVIALQFCGWIKWVWSRENENKRFISQTDNNKTRFKIQLIGSYIIVNLRVKMSNSFLVHKL